MHGLQSHLAQLILGGVSFKETVCLPLSLLFAWFAESLGSVDIRRGIFQGDSLSPLIFAVCMVLLTKILQDVKAGYTLGDVKINHLFFMDDLKIYGKDKAEIESLVSTVQLISEKRDLGPVVTCCNPLPRTINTRLNILPESIL